MKAFAWLLFIGALAGIAFSLWKARRAFAEKRRASEERYASFLISTQAAGPRTAPPAGATSPPATPPPATPASPVAPGPAQRLLYEAAAKAAEAGEPALAIQLYARLLSRFPDGPVAEMARAAAESQKRKLGSSQNSA